MLERSPTTLEAAEGPMLVQTSSPLHRYSSGPTNSLPSGVLQPATYSPSKRPVKHSSRSPRQYTFWNCLHPRWYWGPGNCCKPANAPSHRPRRLREILQLNPTSLSLEPPTPQLDTDTAGHPNHAPSTGALTTIARFAQRPVPVDNPPRRTTEVYLSTSTAPFFLYPFRRLYPGTRTRHATDSAAFHTYGSASNPQS